jgi:general secretion pathway protein K
LVLSRLVTDKELARRYSRLQVQLGELEVWVEIVPSNGLVDVNVAPSAVLEALFVRAGGLTPGEAAILASRVYDFIDSDDEPGGVGGAEIAQYRAAGSPVKPRNARLDDLTELRGVLGMTSELYATISPFLGINGQQRIALSSAPPALIDAISGQPGLGASLLATSAEMRASALPSGLMTDMFTAASSGTSQTIRLRAFIQAHPERWWQREVWADLTTRPEGATPWTTRSVEPAKRVGNPLETGHS